MLLASCLKNLNRFWQNRWRSLQNTPKGPAAGLTPHQATTQSHDETRKNFSQLHAGSHGTPKHDRYTFTHLRNCTIYQCTASNRTHIHRHRPKQLPLVSYGPRAPFFSSSSLVFARSLTRLGCYYDQVDMPDHELIPRQPFMTLLRRCSTTLQYLRSIIS